MGQKKREWRNVEDRGRPDKNRENWGISDEENMEEGKWQREHGRTLLNHLSCVKAF